MTYKKKGKMGKYALGAGFHAIMEGYLIKRGHLSRFYGRFVGEDWAAILDSAAKVVHL